MSYSIYSPLTITALAQTLTTEQEGELAMFSRLLGGLLIVQQRSVARPGVCDNFIDSAYASFIGACYFGDAIDKNDFTSLDGSAM